MARTRRDLSRYCGGCEGLYDSNDYGNVPYDYPPPSPALLHRSEYLTSLTTRRNWTWKREAPSLQYVERSALPEPIYNNGRSQTTTRYPRNLDRCIAQDYGIEGIPPSFTPSWACRLLAEVETSIINQETSRHSFDDACPSKHFAWQRVSQKNEQAIGENSPVNPTSKLVMSLRQERT